MSCFGDTVECHPRERLTAGMVNLEVPTMISTPLRGGSVVDLIFDEIPVHAGLVLRPNEQLLARRMSDASARLVPKTRSGSFRDSRLPAEQRIALMYCLIPRLESSRWVTAGIGAHLPMRRS